MKDPYGSFFSFTRTLKREWRTNRKGGNDRDEPEVVIVNESKVRESLNFVSKAECLAAF